MAHINKYNNTKYQLVLDQILAIRDSIVLQEPHILSPFSHYFPDGHYTPSAVNLAHYLALRQFDLRQLQSELSGLGLSSLGRGEANIVQNIETVIELLKLVSEDTPIDDNYDDLISRISADNESLSHHTDQLLGQSQNSDRHVRIMVTLPSEAATDFELVHALVKGGMDCARINCAHDNQQTWLAMIHHIRRAENTTGRRCRIMMDIAGQKIRTGTIETGAAVHHIKVKKNAFGSAIAPGYIVIVPESKFEMEIPKEFSNSFKISVSDKHFSLLHPGDHLEFHDARNKIRSFEIVKCKTNGIYLGQCWQNIYLAKNTALKHYKSINSKKVFYNETIEIVTFPVTSEKIKVHVGDPIILCPSNIPGRAAVVNESGTIVEPARISISHDEILQIVTPGESVWIDDGKIGTIVQAVTEEGLLLKINHAPPNGATIHADKGLNFPDTELDLSPLTEKDLIDLDFITQYADIVAYSFVQSKEDMSLLLYELKKRNAIDLPVIAKIETKKAVRNLPEIILSAMAKTRMGVMIARGDLAIELGSIRMAEIQEEILWICEAAHIPVVWATQVLETLAKNGIQSRPEITDAAMSVRAECVMLNKGPYILEALNVLDNILIRMQEHQHKKAPRLRALKQWSGSTGETFPDQLSNNRIPVGT